MLNNAYLLAKIGADTAENEPHFAKHLPKNMATTLPYPPRVSRAAPLTMYATIMEITRPPRSTRAKSVM